jgi:predicted RNA-binding protein with TRAM domain
MRRARHIPLLLIFAAAACSPDDGPTATVARQPTLASLDVAASCTDCVFDETFTRGNGPPQLFTRSFWATAGTIYTVTIDDLGSQGADGSVVLNGQTLMAPRAVTGEVGPRRVTVSMTLPNANALEVRLLGKKNSQLKVTVRPKYPCYPDLPAPQLAFESGTIEGQFNHYELDVTNWASFPNELFVRAPDLLPVCGDNANSARAWVEIKRTSDDSFVYGFCTLGAASGLNEIWFAVGPATPGPFPSQVYIEIRDRACGRTYKSNSIDIPALIL